MSPEELAQRAQQVGKEMNVRIGESATNVLATSLDRMGVRQEQIANVMQQPDACDRVIAAGSESVLQEIQRLQDPHSGYHDADRLRTLQETYSEMRDAQRAKRRK